MAVADKPLTFLIFSGPTREYIDPVRFISNESSGKMGSALADQAVKRGNRVVFISGPADFMPSEKVKIINVISAMDMFEAVKANLKNADIIIGAAAVADYTPAVKSKEKIKKDSKELVLKLKKNPDIISYCGENKKKQVVAGFALETSKHIEKAVEKLKNKNLDLITANGKESLGSDKTSVFIISADGTKSEVKNADKKVIAGKIIDETVRIFKNIKTCKKNS